MINKDNFKIVNNKLVSNIFIEKDLPIIEFNGKISNVQDLDFFSRLEISKTKAIGRSGDIDDYIEHSCNPNTGLKIIYHRAFLYTIKTIKPEQEICFDYSTIMFDYSFDCNCGFGNCRRTIKPFKDLDIALKSKYISIGIVPRFILE